MRFFVSKDMIAGTKLTLDPSDAQHVSRVLRMRTGEHISVCDGEGMLYDCVLSAVGKDCVEADIVESREYSNEPSAFVAVFAALSKGDRFDYLIQKSVECGASHIVPFVSEHCVVRVQPDERDKKRRRYAKIAAEASKQCMRTRLVTVGEIVDFKDAVSMASSYRRSLFLYERENRLSLSRAMEGCMPGDSFAVVTGPEGGFSQEEAAFAAACGLECVSIGPRIMRCETAPVAAVCAIMYHTGNFDVGE